MAERSGDTRAAGSKMLWPQYSQDTGMTDVVTSAQARYKDDWCPDFTLTRFVLVFNVQDSVLQTD